MTDKKQYRAPRLRELAMDKEWRSRDKEGWAAAFAAARRGEDVPQAVDEAVDDPHATPTNDELRAWLDANGIAYKARATKAELQALAAGH